MTDAQWLSQIRKKYNDNFKTGEPQFRSLHDLLWQIVINKFFKDEKDPILFHNNVSEHGNELVVAFVSGGCKTTGVYFVNDNYSECSKLTKELNVEVFQIDEKEQMQFISKSMFANA